MLQATGPCGTLMETWIKREELGKTFILTRQPSWVLLRKEYYGAHALACWHP